MTEPIIKATFTVNKTVGMVFMKDFGIKPVCHFCKVEVTEDNFGGIFDKDKVTCDALPCVMKLSDLIK